MEFAKKIKNNIFYDNRGSFSPLSLKILEKDWVQSNISVNPNKWTLRGLHFQKGEYSQAKLIKVIHGRILDFVLDMRIHDNKGLEFFEMKHGDEIFVPREYAHGFITLEENTIVQYLVDNDYQPQSEGSLVWSNFPKITETILKIDPNFDEKLVVISDKDLVEKNG
jgi:dTDP-4-dehydrorhamnose 3,5-epimerase